jgi:plasmid stabilization system protein ParE
VNEFVLTQAAKGDLLKILEYLEGDNPTAILRVVDAIDDAMQLLAEIRASAIFGRTSLLRTSDSGRCSGTW